MQLFGMVPTAHTAVLLAAMFGAIAFEGNEAFRIDKSRLDSKNSFSKFSGKGLEIEAMTSSMKLSDAVDILSRSNRSAEDPGLLKIMQEQVRKGQKSNLRRERKLKKTDPSIGIEVPEYDQSGAQNAKKKLNEMLLEVTEEMDIHNLSCGDKERTTRFLRDELEDEMNKFAALVSSAVEDQVDAQGNMDRLNAARSRLQETEMPLHKRECEEDNNTLYHQLGLVTGDLEVMDSILNMTQCGVEPEYVLVSTANSCEAAGQITITGEDECLSAAAYLNYKDADGQLSKSDYFDRKHGCMWHSAGNVELFDPLPQVGMSRAPGDEPCTYNGYAGCLCKKASASQSSTLIQMECSDLATGRQWMELRPSTSEAQRHLPQLHSDKVKQLMRQTGLVLGGTGTSLLQTTGPEYESKTGKGMCGATDIILESGGWMNESSVQDKCRQLDCSFYTWNKNDTMNIDTVGHAWFCSYSLYDTVSNEAAYPGWLVGRPEPKVKLPEGQLTAKCSIGGSPMCQKLSERFGEIQGGMEDAKQDLIIMISDLDKHCKNTTATMTAQLSLYNDLIAYATRKLSASLLDKTTFSRQQTTNEDALKVASADYTEKMKGCTDTWDELKNEKCALTTIRNELMKMNNFTEHPVDCEMQDWLVEKECDVTCGGGKEQLSRGVKIPANGGADCPTHKLERTCNEQACPVDCVAEDWSEWSTCTQTCGGGFQERSRPVIPEEHGGEHCETTKQEPCNTNACGGDCVLADWIATPCNKHCGGGKAKSTRAVVTEAWGQGGSCPSFYDPDRYRLEDCNVEPCQVRPEATHCRSKLDVTFVLDGSGSLGAAGFHSVKMAAAKVIEAMDGTSQKGDVMVNTILYSGPSEAQVRWICLGQTWKFSLMSSLFRNYWNSRFPNLEPLDKETCGIENLRTDPSTTGNNFWTSDTVAAANSIKELPYPNGWTLTSLALIRAQEEIETSRPGVQSVIVLITDGRAYSMDATAKQAENIKKKGARLIVIAAGQGLSPEDIEAMKLWSGGPQESWEERKSFLRVDDLDDLDKVSTISDMVENICDPSGLVDA